MCYSAAMVGLIRLAFVAIALETLYCIPRIGLELALGNQHQTLLTAASFVVATALATLTWLLRSSLRRCVDDLSQRTMALSAYAWLALVLGIGLMLRFAWLAAFPTELYSDGKVYFYLARRLYETGIYRDDQGGYAYWPPGYPMFLVAFMRLFGVQSWIPIVANLLLFCGTVPLVWRIGALVRGEGTGRVAAMLIALWPNLIFTVGTGSKELLLAFLLPLAIVLYVTPRSRLWLGRIAKPLGAGSSLGLAALTWPATALFAFVLLAYDIIGNERPIVIARRFLPVLAVLGLIVGAWAYRNYLVLGTPVIATNGGNVFYLANNPLADGGYSEVGERSLAGLTEVERNRTGSRWAWEWIRSHPGDYLRLVLRKHLYFLGDDSMGAYETLKRGFDISDSRYAIAKAASNSFWLLLWMMILVNVVRQSEGGEALPLITVLMLSVCCFYAMDSLFQGGSRHHVPVAASIAALATLGTVSIRRDREGHRAGTPTCRSDPRSSTGE